MASNRWSSTTLGALIDADGALLQTGPFGSQLHSYDYVADGVPVVPTEAIGHRRLKSDAVPQITREKAVELARHRLLPGDILFARRGVQATGYSALVEPQHEGWLCGTGAILLRVKSGDIDPQFLSFYLADSITIDWLKSHAVGAVMPNLNESVLRNLPIALPPIRAQRHIARILGALDDKIEQNRRMNETLEGMARALFKSWFVDFDPVRAKLDGRPPPGLDPATAALKRLLKLKKPKLRSPNYPVVGLEKAVELIEKLNGKYGTHKVPIKLLLALWEYNAESGVGNQCVAALKAYGLADVEGEGDERKVSLTKEAARVAGNAPDRSQLLKNAAIRPRVHMEILRHYGKQGLPADDLLKQYLVWERPEGQRFNPNFVEEFIKRFRATLEFAGVVPADIIPDDEDEDDEDSSSSGSSESSSSLSQSSLSSMSSSSTDASISSPSSLAGGTRTLKAESGRYGIVGKPADSTVKIPVTLPSLKVAWLEIPIPLTEAEFTVLAGALAMYKVALTTTTADPNAAPQE